MVRSVGPRREEAHAGSVLGGPTFHLWPVQMLISEELSSVLVDLRLEALLPRNSDGPQTGKRKVKCSGRGPQDGL